MVALAAIVGRKIAIRPKRKDDWTVVPNLWGAIIGRPGVLKIPMLQETTRPITQLEIKAAKRFHEETRRNNAKLMVAEQRRNEAASRIRKAIRNGEDADSIAEDALAYQERNAAPIRRRYIVNDSTVEKLGEILNQNPNGVLYFRDELIGFLRSLEREGQESARFLFGSVERKWTVYL